MNKLRSDSTFCQLTPQQTDTLEGWLFEERLSYPKVVERLKAEFGLETSLTGVRRFYKRLDVERSRQNLTEVVETSGWVVDALKRGTIKPGMLLLANKCAFELMMQSEPPIRKVTALLRAITSAEAHAMRQTVRDQEEAERRERKRLREVEESWRITPWDLEQEREERRQERASRKKAKLEAAEKAAKETEISGGADRKSDDDDHLSPALSPKGGEGEDTGASVVPVVPAHELTVSMEPARPLTPTLSPGGGEGEERTAGDADVPGTKHADGAWQPSVVEERENAENYTAEAAEDRLTPLKFWEKKKWEEQDE